MASFIPSALYALAKREEEADPRDGLSREEREAYSMYCGANPGECPIDTSFYYYRVSIGANATFLALFALSFLMYLLTMVITWRRSKIGRAHV